MADTPPLTPAEAEHLLLHGAELQCSHCRGWHVRACPRIRKLRYHPNGALAAVVFWRPGDWPEEGVFFQEQLEEWAAAKADPPPQPALGR